MSTPPAVPSTLIGGLRIQERLGTASLELVLSGSAELRSPEQLATALLHWHAHALRLEVQQVSVDFRDVEFMNSSALSAFLRWFNELRSSPKAYRVCLVYDTNVRWQRGSISALSSFAVELVTTSNVPRA